MRGIRVMEHDAWPPADAPEWKVPSRLVVAVGTDGGVAAYDPGPGRPLPSGVHAGARSHFATCPAANHHRKRGAS